MARKIAAACSLLAFAVCLIQGIDAENTFATTVRRALIAMGVTFFIGLIVGSMAESMTQENARTREKTGDSEQECAAHDR
jgi:K+-sensing histidine kinase KdpD